jgi:hypothetical protein
MARHVRDLRLERFWRDHVKHQPSSGLSVRGYCDRHGLKEPAFYAWRRTIAGRDAAAPNANPPAAATSTPTFLPVAVVDRPAGPSSPAPATETPIEIILRGGRRVRVRHACDRQLLADVLVLLEGRSC